MSKLKLIEEIIKYQKLNNYTRRELKELSKESLEDILKDEEINYSMYQERLENSKGEIPTISLKKTMKIIKENEKE